MEFNINGDVWIRLTGAGTRAYNLHYEKLGMEPPRYKGILAIGVNFSCGI